MANRSSSAPTICRSHPLRRTRAPRAAKAIAQVSAFAGLAGFWALVGASAAAADFHDPGADRETLPSVPPGFEVSFFAREPLVRQPCSMAFDRQGRLYVGMGPQYRNPTPDTPGDSVVLVLDSDGDSQADQTKVFATGFNAVQGLAWHGRDLWVANAPDLTVVRDLDGDDVADEYVRVYTDLGNLEHGLHGLNWAPDGRLYMSKGNSKGLTQPGRIAPKPFRDLWGVTAPAGAPDFPAPTTHRPREYQHAYHDPSDDWGREGGVLRCDDGGQNLEIVSRGFRNPWDITYDSGFNWLGTDNDQTMGDRIFMPFFGAHFGWNHPWHAQWADRPEAPIAPVSGPLFEGSGTGIVFGESERFPDSHRGVFFINDWLRKTTFVWRPRWDGASMRPAGGDWNAFVVGGRSLFRPTDLEFGPDGALWILGWSSGYGAEYKDGELANEGRVFRVTWKSSGAPTEPRSKRARPLGLWTFDELIDDFDAPLPIWRVDAQEELLRRGHGVRTNLMTALLSPGTRTAAAGETWMAWTLGRMTPEDAETSRWFVTQLESPGTSLNLRVQALRILVRRAQLSRRAVDPAVAEAMHDREARVRLEAVLGLLQSGEARWVPAVLDAAARETDRTMFYAAWQGLGRLASSRELRERLLGNQNGRASEARSGARRALLLALLESHALTAPEVKSLADDSAAEVRALASLWLAKAAEGGGSPVIRGRPLDGATPDGTLAGDSALPARSPASLVRKIQARSGARYVAVPGGLRPGARSYTDRGYPLREVPGSLAGLEFIQTANEDDGSQGEGFLSFESLMPVRVLVGTDARMPQPPAWVRAGFQRDTRTLRADHWTFNLYFREFPAGRISLGGNTDDGRAGGKGNYIVVLEPLPLAAAALPANLDQSLSMMAAASPDRGAWLFHDRAGTGCFNCHRLRNHGNAFGPDLAALGDRATVRHIVQSLLDPNAVITEGFHLQTVTTSDAEFSGVLLEESGLSVTLGLATGERRGVAKKDIVSRQTAKVSAMPAFDSALSPSQVADLTAYLMAQRTAAAVESPKPAAGKTAPVGFAVQPAADRVAVVYAGRPVAEFVYQDPKTLRPYLANVHAPDGFKVTRNHPPIAGVDATDHDTMHPGLWLGFGDVSGVDFWRNRGRMEHRRFLTAPAVLEGRVRWVQECALIEPAGRTIGFATHRVEITAVPPVSNAPGAPGEAGAAGVAGPPWAWRMTWEADFRSDAGEIVFGDQEEMGFGARVATALTEKNGGLITSSEGLTTAQATWGQAARWCDYSRSVDGRRVGIVLMADPANFRPSWWHNRDYGVFVANPFGRAAMRQGGKSEVKIARGDTLKLRFGALIYSQSGERTAEARSAEIESAWRAWQPAGQP